MSLNRQDDFLHRQGFVSEQSRLVDDPKRFASFNSKTLGFVLVRKTVICLYTHCYLQIIHEKVTSSFNLYTTAWSFGLSDSRCKVLKFASLCVGRVLISS